MAKKDTKIRDMLKVTGVANTPVARIYNEYKNLLLNAIGIVPTSDKVEDLGAPLERFIKNELVENNAVGFDKVAQSWARCYGQGINDIGYATTITFVTMNGRSWAKPASYNNYEYGAYIIKGTQSDISIGEVIKDSAEKLAKYEVAIQQNVDACKTPYIISCDNPDIRYSLEVAVQQKLLGQAVIVANEDVGNALKAVNISVPFLADKFEALEDLERNKLLTKLGIMTANEKKERVQATEVNATLGQATDYIYSLIDFFNQQCDTFDIPYKMVFNGSMEELYINGEEAPQVDQNELINNENATVNI